MPKAATEDRESSYDVSAENLKALSGKLVELLRIRTLPIGLKLFTDARRMMKIPGIRTPTEGFHFTMCEVVGAFPEPRCNTMKPASAYYWAPKQYVTCHNAFLAVSHCFH